MPGEDRGTDAQLERDNFAQGENALLPLSDRSFGDLWTAVALQNW